MLSNNPFSILSETIPVGAMQLFYNCNGIVNCCWNYYTDDTS